MSDNPYEYSAQITRVIDGDTVEVDITKSRTIDFGFKFKQQLTATFQMRVRLYGVDTPETYGVKKGSEEYEAGQKAKAFVVDWLDMHCARSAEGHWLVHLKTHDGKKLDAHQGKYHGRWLAEVWSRGAGVAEAVSLTEALKAAGHDKLSP